MPDIPSTTAVSATTAVGGVSTNNIIVETAVNNLPDKIQQLARQIEVNGLIAQPPSGGAITINTVIGPLTLLLPHLAQMQQDKMLQQLLTLFQNQKPLTVVLQPGNPPAQAFLLLPPLTTGTPYTNNLNIPAPASSARGPLPPLLPNISLSAVVLPESTNLPPVAAGQFNPYANPNAPYPAAASTPPVNLSNSLGVPLIEPTEETVAAALAKLEGKALPDLIIAQPNAPHIPFPVPPASIYALQPPSEALAKLLKPGTELNIQISAIIPPPSPGAPPPPLPQLQPNQILATVTGNGPAGQPILKTDTSTLFVRQPVDVSAGTQVVVTISPAPDDTPAYLTLPDPKEFTGLQQIIAALTQADPVAARSIIANHIPQPGEGLPGALLFFLSAVRQGDVRGWLGNGALDLLTRAGKAELVNKLIQDLQQAGQIVRDNVVGEWKAYPVPIHDNNQVNILHFYVHNDRSHHNRARDNPDPSQKASQPVRFLIDLRMSKLGAMQLDGFLRQKQLDIMMRSEQPLPPGLDRELRQGYTRILEAIGYTGGINFQTGRQGWLNLQKPAAHSAMVT